MNIFLRQFKSQIMDEMTFDRKSFVLLSKLTQSYLALYEIRVSRTGVLPPTSFRFHVTMDTLALG